MSLQSTFRKLNRLIEYIGIACAIDLMRTPLLAFEINFSFQPMILLANRSRRSLKVFTLFLPPTIGKPKYFPKSVIIWALNMRLISSLTCNPVLRLKNKYVFCLVIAWLEACLSFSRMRGS